MHLDHTMPLSHLYPLDETATCLCATCNLAKSDTFPINFYNAEQLLSLSKITGIDHSLLTSTLTNQAVVDELKNQVVWFFDEFLQHPEYLKDRDGKIAANSILHSIKKAISKSTNPFDLDEAYKKAKANT